ncbi:MAG: Hpt domain-containing protein, partial [Kangiellaceae bacterium]|nr:Hpt domain-containing protein [Kangiellaceae bacterium]
LVGAKVIGEVSWAVENMLNKVIEESIPAEVPVISVLNEIHAMLPKLVKAFAEQRTADCDYEQLAAKAEHIASGKPLSEFSFVSEAIVEPAEAEESIEEVSTTGEAIDPVLLEIFSTEAETHLQAIAGYLNDAPAEGSVAVTDELIRALHTLKGSAHMAGVDVIASLTGPWEKFARLSKGSNQRFDQNIVALLKSTHQVLNETLEKLKASQPLDVEGLNEIQNQVASLKASTGASGEATTAQRDQQFVSIFLTEGLDILHEVTKLNEKLERDLSDSETCEAIRVELHTFRRGAEMLAIPELEKLAAASEKLATFATNRDSLEASFTLVLIEAVESLNAMLNKIASEEDLASPEDLLQKIDQWIAGPTSDSPPEDMDVELVELFVEEGEELIETARELIPRWKENLNSKELNAELRRIYHTLKGSSRMAGAMAVGDLGYAAEDMFNTVIDFGREQSGKDCEIIDATTDKLEAMIAELKTLRWPADATRDVEIIRNHLAGKPAEVEPSIEEVVVTDVPLDIPAVEESAEAEVADLESTELESTELELSELETVEQEALEIETPEVIISELEAPAFETEDSEASELELDAIESIEEVEPLDETPQQEAEEFILESVEEEIPELPIEDSLTLEVESQDEPELTIEPAEEIESLPVDADEDFVSETVEEEIPLLDVEEEPELEAPGIEISGVEESEVDETYDAVAEDEQEISLEALDVTETAETETIETEIAAEEVQEAETETLDVESFEEVIEEPAEPSVAEEIEVKTEDAEQEVAEIEAVKTEEFEPEEIEETPAISEVEEVEFEKVETPVSETVFVENTIAPSAPVVVTGNLHKVELDEDGEEVLEIYLEEAEELLVALDEALHEWLESLENKNAIDMLQRTLHTFKGGARLSDLVVLGDLTHEMETYFERVNSGQLTPKQSDVDFLLQGYDVIASLVKEVSEHRQMTVPEAYMQSLLALIEGKEVIAKDEAPAEAPSVQKAIEMDQEKAEEVKPVAEVVSFEKKKQEQVEAKAKPAQTAEVVRVPADQLEGLVNLAGETSIFRSRLEQQMSVLKYNLEEMSSTIERLRDQLRNLDIETEAQIVYRREISGGSEYEDFDPLEMDRYTRQQELTRGLGESAVDLMSLKETLDTLTSDSETLLLQQGRVNTEMQESLMRTRMTPFESLVPRLRRMVRQISTELGKTIELSISAEGEMDRTVLERMIAPLEHMLRNAVVHGVEDAGARQKAGKPAVGRITIRLHREG